MNARGEPVNGWSSEEIERLVRKTGADRGRVEDFCRVVDKQLFLMLGERQRRATLRFHLASADPTSGAAEETGLPPARPPRIE
jgi:hypothetical protein